MVPPALGVQAARSSAAIMEAQLVRGGTSISRAQRRMELDLDMDVGRLAEMLCPGGARQPPFPLRY